MQALPILCITILLLQEDSLLKKFNIVAVTIGTAIIVGKNAEFYNELILLPFVLQQYCWYLQ